MGMNAWNQQKERRGEMRYLLFVTALLLLVLIGFSSPLIAQEKPRYLFPPIVVTATRTEKSVEDVSATVSVVTEEDIEASNATSCTDILNTLPGLFVQKTGSFGRADVDIRGIGQRGRRIMVLIDGRPVKMGLFGCTVTHSLPLNNVKRIEVVRGPLSVLYGSDALGGVINIITKRAKQGFETDATASYGTYNTQQYRLRHGGTFKRFYYYFTADKRRTDGHRPNSDYDGEDYTAKAGLTLLKNVEATFSGKYFHGKKWEPGPESNPTPDAWNDYKRWAIDLTFTGKWEKSDASLKFYRNYGHHKFSDGWHSKDYTNGIMFKYSTKALVNNEFTFGFDFRKQGGKRLSSPERKWDKSEYAFFLLNEYTFFRRTILSLGGRWNHDSVYGGEFCPHVGLVFHPGGGTILRSAVNKGFRSPQINELYMFPPSTTDLKPERVWNYELGLEQRITDRLLADVVFYRIKGDNLIERGPNPSPPPKFRFQNTGEFDFKGLEVGLKGVLGKGLSGMLYYTHLDVGDKTKGRPENKIDLSLRYRQGRFFAAFNAQYVADYYAEDEHQKPLPDYLLVNLKVTYRLLPYLKLFCAVDNLFDRRYKIYADLPGAGAGVYPMPGRSFTAGLSGSI